MPSRKTLLLGAGALTLIALLVVLVTRGGDPSLTIERGKGSAFPLRGSLADDRDAIDDALRAWKDGRGAAADTRAGRLDEDEDVHLLYAGTVKDRDVVIVSQNDRLIGIRQPFDRGWSVSNAVEGFDAFDSSPVVIDGSVLLPAGGDWTFLPLRDKATRPQAVDGLISDGDAYSSGIDPGFVVDGTEPRPNTRTKVFDTTGGLFGVDAANRRGILDASRHPGRLMAIHAALVDDDEDEDAEDPETKTNCCRTFDVLWTGRLAGVPQAAVVAGDDPGRRLGLGLVTDPDAVAFSSASVELGSRTSPLGVHRDGAVGAAYVPGDDQPRTLVAAATSPVDRIEFLVGTRRVTRPGPVAIVPVDWDPQTDDVVVLGRTAGGAVVTPLVTQSP